MRSRRNIRVRAYAAALLFVALAVAVGVGASSRDPARRPGVSGPLAPHRPGEVLVKFRPEAPSTERARLRAELGASRLYRTRGGVELLRLGSGRSAAEALWRLGASALVEYVEPNYIVHAHEIPDDPRLGELYGLVNSGQTGGRAGADIDAARAWQVSTGSKAVLVAVIDTGIDHGHPDLAENIWINPAEVQGNGIDDDANGYVDDVRGWDFINGDNDPYDDRGHGTHVAGTIGAIGNNGRGISGVNWKVSLVPLKFLGSDGSGSTANALRAIEYATAIGVDVINNSWGTSTPSLALLEAIESAGRAGILVVASAGNAAADTDRTPQYPSAYASPYVLSVAATDDEDRLATFSNFGATTVDLAAPGVATLSTLPGGSYGLNSGTSMSAPHVSGAAALVRAVRPEIDPLALKELLLANADPVDGLAGRVLTGGRLNAYRPIEDADQVPPGPIVDLRVEESTSNTVILSWTAPGDDGYGGTAATYDLRISSAPIDASNFEGAASVAGTPAPAESGTPQRFEVEGLESDSLYAFALRARDEWSNVGPVGPGALARTLPPPTLSGSPDSFAVELFTGQRAARTLRLTNAGDGTLDWSIARPRLVGPGGPAPAAALTISAGPGRLHAGESADVGLEFDARGLGSGEYAGELNVVSNDPRRPVQVHAIALRLSGAPDIELVGEPVEVESVRGFGEPEATTRHELLSSIPPRGAGRLVVSVEGDFGVGNEIATVSGEGLSFGTVGGSGADCGRAEASFELAAGDLAGLLADGILEIEIANAPHVGLFCGRNAHQVRLEYRGPGNRIDFGVQSVGAQRARSFRVENHGAATLHVGPVTSSTPVFRPDPLELTVEPGAAAEVAVHFAPTDVGRQEGTLSVPSDDPDRAIVLLETSGDAVGAPQIELDPPAVSETLHVGGRAERTVSLSNRGAHPLEVDLALVAAGTATTRGAGSVSSSSIPRPAPRFSELAPSPEPLGCVVEDPAAGLLYGEAAASRAFYRYDPSSGDWERLADPVLPAGGVCGTALLDGRIYTFHAGEAARMGIYDIASDNWSTEPTPLGLTATVASDGERYLYLLRVTAFLRFDPHSGESRAMAFPPFAFQSRGGLRPLDGKLYGHQGGGGTGFAVYDIASDSWAPLPSVPEGAVLGSAIDPLRREYFAYGTYGGRNLYRYSIDRAEWTVSTIPSFSVRDGGLGWLAEPAGLYLIEGYQGPKLIRAEFVPPFVAVGVDRVRIEPGADLDVALTFDAADLPPATYAADLGILSNDPLRPRLDLPLRLEVIGGPHLVVRGEQAVVESGAEFIFDGSHTTHRLGTPDAAPAEALFELTATGDFGSGGEVATLIVDGLTLGSVGEAGEDCLAAARRFSMSAADFEAISADGEIEVRIDNSPAVNARCSINRHDLRVVYRKSIDPLDFGALRVAESRGRALEVANLGTESLELSDVASDEAAFEVAELPQRLAPGDVVRLELTFGPQAAGAFDGQLSFVSDDPDEPLREVSLVGSGVDPPRLRVEPQRLDVALRSGDRGEYSFHLYNDGGAAVGFELALDGAASPAFVVSPTIGHLPPGGSIPLLIRVDGRGLLPGRRELTLSIVGDDPAQAPLAVDLAVDVVGAPNLELRGESIEAVSSVVFDAPAGRSEHALAAPFLPGGAARLRVVAQGDFGAPSEFAIVTVEGLEIGSVGGSGEDCVAVTAVFELDAATTAELLADGRLEVRVDNTPAVDGFCPDNRHTVELAYDTTVDPLEFGSVFVGGTLSRAVVVSNEGSDPLEFGWSSDTAAIDPDPGPRVVPPGEAFEVRVAFRPLEPGPVAGTLTIETNDPEHPRVTLATIGRAREAPRAVVEPASLEATLAAGAGATLDLRLSNVGASLLEIGPSIEPANAAAFVRFDDGPLRLLPGAFHDLTLELDAAQLLDGRHAPTLILVTNDPLRPRIEVPLTLNVIGTPDLRVTGEPVDVESSIDFDAAVDRTVHLFDGLPRPAAEPNLALVVIGDFGAAAESATVRLDGEHVGVIGGAGPDCIVTRENFGLAADELDLLLADGTASIDVINSPAVDTFCPINRHVVRLTYPSTVEVRDFGTVYVGHTAARSIRVENRGTATLDVQAVSIEHADFGVDAQPFALAPGESRSLEVALTPSEPANVTATLTLLSTDPDTPETRVALIAAALEPPQIEIQPDSIDVELSHGGSGTTTLALGNRGGSPLDFGISIEPASLATSVRATPHAGTLAPAATAAISIELDGGNRLPGTFEGRVVLASNDPATPRVELPLVLTVRSDPDIAVVGQSVRLESVQSFTGIGGRSTHRLELEAPPAGAGTLSVTVSGGFRAASQTAEVYVAGSLRGTLGGIGTACGSALLELALDAEELRELVFDGALEIEVRNSPDVGAGCDTNLHGVRLDYLGVADRLDFAPTVAGARRTLAVIVENRGTELLLLDAGVAVPGVFGVAGGIVELPPGAAQQVAVEFRPAAAGLFESQLRLASNDPDEPLLTLALHGAGLPPPLMELEPEAFEVTVHRGDGARAELIAINRGTGPLRLSVASAPTASGPHPSLRVIPSAATIAPGGQLRMDVILAAGGLAAGAHSTAIHVFGDDPSNPERIVPVTLHVVAAANLVLRGLPIEIASARPFSTRGARTMHELVLDQPSSGPGRLEITADGDFGASVETVAVSVEGHTLGAIGGAGSDCRPVAGEFELSPLLLAEAAERGRLAVTLQNSGNVDPGCTTDLHRVRLSYRGPLEALDLGNLLRGERTVVDLVAANPGTEPLRIHAIVSDVDDAVIEPAALTLAPGAAREIRIEFEPSVAAEYAGTVRIDSDDPRRPSVVLPFSARVLEPARLEFEPAEVQAELFVGGRLGVRVGLRNSGGSPLEFALSPSLAGMTRVGAVPAAGTVPAGATADVELRFVASEISETVSGELRLTTNDPAGPRSLPLAVVVRDGPDMVVEELVERHSESSFTGLAGATVQRLAVDRPPLGGGRLTLVADGDFGRADAHASASLEGRPLGTFGATGVNCAPAESTVELDRSELKQLSGDGVVEVELRNGYTVQDFCPRNVHSVQLTYPAAPERIALGAAFVGRPSLRELRVRNRGTQMLEFFAGVSDPGRFSVRPAMARLDPGESTSLAVELTPDGTGPVEGKLVLTGNDPDAPRVEIPIEGHGIARPRAGVEPERFEERIAPGEQRTTVLTLTNSGTGALGYRISIELDPPGSRAFPATDRSRLFATDGRLGNLFQIDPPTAAATLLSTPQARLLGMAAHPETGALYAGRPGGVSELVIVNPLDGSASVVGAVGLGTIRALDFDSRGRLYAVLDRVNPGDASGGDTLVWIDADTGAATLIGQLGAEIGALAGDHGVEGLAFDAADILYGASEVHTSTRGDPQLYRVDTVTGRATSIGPIVDGSGNPVPGGVASLQFGPDGTLYGGTGGGGGRLIRIDPTTAVYTLIGDALLHSIEALALDSPDAAKFVDIAERAGVLAPGESRAVELVLGGALAVGDYRAAVVIASDDPDSPRLRVPIDLHIAGSPRVAVLGETVTLASSIEYHDSGDRTRHRFVLPVPPEGAGRVELVADGDFGQSLEQAALRAESEFVGLIGRSGADCIATSEEYTLDAARLLDLAADGIVEFEVRNTIAVNPSCSDNRHRVELSYQGDAHRVDFGTIFLGATGSRVFVVRNEGQSELVVGPLIAPLGEISIEPERLTLGPAEQAVVRLSYTPAREGPFAAELRVDSNDPARPTVALRLTGEALAPPIVFATQERIVAARPPGSTTPRIRPFRLENQGGSELSWVALAVDPRPGIDAAAVAEWVERSKGDETDTGAGAIDGDAAGGPDGFGYVFRDSDAADGPAFDWIELDPSGRILALDGDDEISEPIELGFEFPFYGSWFDRVRVCTNGWLSFTSERTSYSNPDRLPNAGIGVPENLVAPFWDDLHPREFDRIRYQRQGARFVVQYSGVDRLSGGASLTFQVVLEPSGRILFQYLEMEGVTDSATIGIQDGPRTLGLLVAYNRGYVRDRLAVELAPVPQWVSVAPSAGIVPPGSSAELELRFSAAGLPPGDHGADLVIASNDPANETLTRPLALHVGEVEARLVLTPATLNPASNGRWIRARVELPPGLDPRQVDLQTVTFEGGPTPDPGQVRFFAPGRDGNHGLELRFDRAAFAAALPAGERVEVTIVGEVRDVTWFRATTTLRVRGDGTPRATGPDPAESRDRTGRLPP